ncbi:GNAT family N-acetyltransferase, partial [Nocardioides hankookensis]
MTGWRHARSERLWLDAVSATDLDGVHAIHADPATWTHFPAGRHVSPEMTAGKIDQMVEQWSADGLGYWGVRESAGGPVVGVAGCAVPAGFAWWNLYYRFAVSAQGR